MKNPYLDTRQLEAFVAVVSIGSMTGASRALGYSQPVVTRLIQELEAELGFALLHRNGPRISPTQQGVAFYEQAEIMLSGLRIVAERARAISSSAPQPIEISSLPSLAASAVPQALAKLVSDERPERIYIRTAAAEAIVQAVADRTADIGLTSLPLDNPGVEVHWTAEVSCVAVVARAHRLAQRASLVPEDLVGETLITSHNPYRLRLSIDQALASFKSRPAAFIDSNSSPVSIALARKGLGVALIEPLTMTGLPIEDVVILPLSFRIPFRFGLITAAGRPLSAAVERLIGVLKDQIMLVAAELDDCAAADDTIHR